MILVLVFGTFDLLHPGHLFFLKQARKRGDKLIVSVARDSFVLKMKKQPPLYTEQERMAHLRNSGLVDEIHLSDPVPGTYQLILARRPQLICLGYDQLQLKSNLSKWLKEHELNIPIEIVPSFEPEKFKSSLLKQELFVAIDLKTTGQTPRQDNLVELGAVLFNREKVLDVFHAFIRPVDTEATPAPGGICKSINDQRPCLLQPLTEVLPVFVRFCRNAYPVTRNAEILCSFLLYNLSYFHIETLELADRIFDIDSIAKNHGSEPLSLIISESANRKTDIQGENHPSDFLHSALDDAHTYQHIFSDYLTNTHNPAFIQSLYTENFAVTADGEALNFNWQGILRCMNLLFLEEQLFNRKILQIGYLHNQTLVTVRIIPLALCLEHKRLTVLAHQEGHGKEKIISFYLNRIKVI